MANVLERSPHLCSTSCENPHFAGRIAGSSEVPRSNSIHKVMNESSNDNSTYCPPSVCSDVSDDSLEWDNDLADQYYVGPNGDLADDEDYDQWMEVPFECKVHLHYDGVDDLLMDRSKKQIPVVRSNNAQARKNLTEDDHARMSPNTKMYNCYTSSEFYGKLIAIANHTVTGMKQSLMSQPERLNCSSVSYSRLQCTMVHPWIWP